MHDIEDAIQDTLNVQEYPTALYVAHSILKGKYKKNREVYTSSGKSPVFTLKGQIDKRKASKLRKLFAPIIEELAIDHDLQWGEILNLINGYLRVHSAGSSYVFSYEPK